MALTTYTELKAAVATQLHRTDLTTPIIDFITLGEIRLNARLRVRSMEDIGTLTTVAGTPTVALPTGYRKAKALYINTSPKVELEWVSQEIFYRDYAGASSGIPSVFTTQGENVVFAPTPGSVYTLYMPYYRAATALSGSTATNTLFPRYANLYLYAAMVEAGIFLEDDAMAQKYKAVLDEGIAMAQREDEADRASGSTLRVRSDHGNP